MPTTSELPEISSDLEGNQHVDSGQPTEPT